MSAYKHNRCAAIVLLAALAAGCGGGSHEAPHGTPHGAPPPQPESTPHGHAGAPMIKSSPQRPFTLVASGEIIPSVPEVLGTAQRDARGVGYDFRPILAGVKPVVSSADLAVCHLGAPLGLLSGPFTGYPVFQSPPQLASALKATGYDSCSTASNHVLDRGMPGVHRTLRAMETVGLRHVGSARSATEAARSARVLARTGAKVAHLSYTYGTNGAQRPVSAPWTVNLLDEEKIIADARAARRAGADIVIVSAHWGTEYRTVPNQQQIRLAQALTAARTGDRPDIDLVLGTHAHTPQPYEKVNGTWVVYGLGDQVSGRMKRPQGNWGTLARFRFKPPDRPGERWKVTKAEYIPQLAVQGPPLRMVNLARTPGYASIRKAISRAVLSRGAADEGLKMGR
ncbi:CapA family protein [Streptomyces piniterrae]|uniref:CapA family protein n=1 Tax=Streptomyces piniterrae TaxID=2571125 RepID=A0A4U0NRB3_9ACTN|nr:CapA family protein [Streptomyces piniterrae]TJZ57023.1 CapA family protein [Streptomyces piniterrae]